PIRGRENQFVSGVDQRHHRNHGLVEVVAGGSPTLLRLDLGGVGSDHEYFLLCHVSLLWLIGMLANCGTSRLLRLTMQEVSSLLRPGDMRGAWSFREFFPRIERRAITPAPAAAS